MFVGQDKVHIMQYDPSLPMHERYVRNAPPAGRTIDSNGLRKTASLCVRALGYDLNTVEFACEDGVPYAMTS